MQTVCAFVPAAELRVIVLADKILYEHWLLEVPKGNALLL